MYDSNTVYKTVDFHSRYKFHFPWLATAKGKRIESLDVVCAFAKLLQLLADATAKIRITVYLNISFQLAERIQTEFVYYLHCCEMLKIEIHFFIISFILN